MVQNCIFFIQLFFQKLVSEWKPYTVKILNFFKHCFLFQVEIKKNVTLEK